MNDYPVIDKRKAEDIYKQAIQFAKVYCPEWAQDWVEEDHFDPEDPGLVMFKLFSHLMEYLIGQLNKVPEKYRLAFLDFMGIDNLAPQSAKVALSFYLSKGATGTNVPAGTLVASEDDPDIMFETNQGVSVVSSDITDIYSLNPWGDSFTDHLEDKSGETEGFTIFAGDRRERKLEHILYLGDDKWLDIPRASSLTIKITGEYLAEEYFAVWHKQSGEAVSSSVSGTISQQTIELKLDRMDKSLVDRDESFWLSVRPRDDLRIVESVNLDLPVISG
ncbi:MAG: hypothetical protein OEZ36_13000, partial [Spirochaetota bacterium]|nr:hypothetical protein [Spirochaetota bacterium]